MCLFQYMFIRHFLFTENSSRFIGLYEFDISASELELQQYAAGAHCCPLSDCLLRVLYMLSIQVFGPSSGPSLMVNFSGSPL